MEKKYAKIPAAAAFIIQFALVIASTWLIQNQSRVAKALYEVESNIKVIPISFWVAIIKLILYGMLFVAITKDNKENRRPFGLFLIVLSVLVTCLGTIGGVWMSTRLAYKGEKYMAAYAIISQAINTPQVLLTAFSIPLFYIACGRFGTNKQYKPQGLLAIIFQSIVVIISVCVILNRKLLVTLMKLPEYVLDADVFPVKILFSIALLIVFILFYLIINKSNANCRLKGIIFTALVIMINIGTTAGEAAQNSAVGLTKGGKAIAAFSLINSVINLATFIFYAVAIAAFFVSVGRFGVSDKNME